MALPSAKDGLRSIQEIEESYRSLFESYPCFNRVQSAVFDNIIHSTRSLVITAPTGSGKTVLFELALVKLLMDSPRPQDIKAVYVAPVKALCNERFQDWSPRFAPLGVSCVEVTGDSIDHCDLLDHQLILTTPEKWDSLTRRWRDNLGLVSIIKLIMIDEVHLLNDPKRGPILEAIVCRMKTVVKAMKDIEPVRFVAVSATIFNIEDLGQWLGEGSAICQRFGSEMRPVRLKQVVRGYPLSRGQSPFQFDINLSFKLKSIISEFSEGKPVLIFCSTRRGVVQTCQTLADQLGFKFSPQQTAALNSIAVQVSDNKLRNFMLKGVGYHHAGMITEDRVVTQNAFASSSLPVLVATSTLAMGVNLPAHLVIIKSTHQFLPGSVTEYPETSILQMVGRAGRPQFDNSATAVIMTRQENAKKYENLLDCKEVLESSLHLHLPEHINSEVVLLTIRDLGVAMDWLRCTFLYQRALKNPAHYGLTRDGSVSKIEKELETMLLRELNALQREELVVLNDNGMDISPTANGRIMSHYYINFQTFKLFKQVDEKSSLKSLIMLLSSAYELSESQLRVNERRVLNELNECKTKATVRFPIKGKIKTRELKVNCLTQACLGCLPITEAPLQQEAIRIVNSMERVVKCLAEYLLPKKCYSSYYSTTLLTKCLHARLWEDSLFVARQLDRIGPTLASSLVVCGKTSFAALEQSHPQELEKIVNRKPPLGNNIIEQVRHLPRYNLNASVEKESVLRCVVHVRVEMVNADFVSNQSTAGSHHALNLIIGDTSNRLLHQRRIADTALLKNAVQSQVVVQAPLPMKIFVHLVSEQWVGLDLTKDFVINPMAPVVVDSRCHLPPAEIKQKKTAKKKEGNDPSVLPYFKKNAPTKDKNESGGTVTESVVIVESNLNDRRTNSPLNAAEIQEELDYIESAQIAQKQVEYDPQEGHNLNVENQMNSNQLDLDRYQIECDPTKHQNLNIDNNMNSIQHGLNQIECDPLKTQNNLEKMDSYQLDQPEYDPPKNQNMNIEKKSYNNQLGLDHYQPEYDPPKSQNQKPDKNRIGREHHFEYEPLKYQNWNEERIMDNNQLGLDHYQPEYDPPKSQNHKPDKNRIGREHHFEYEPMKYQNWKEEKIMDNIEVGMEQYQPEYDPPKNKNIENKLYSNKLGLDHQFEYEPMKYQNWNGEKQMDDSQLGIDHNQTEYDPPKNQKPDNNQLGLDHHFEYEPMRYQNCNGEKIMDNNQLGMDHYLAEYDPPKNENMNIEKKLYNNQPGLDHHFEYEPMEYQNRNGENIMDHSRLGIDQQIEFYPPKPQNTSEEKKIANTQLVRGQNQIDPPKINQKRNPTIRPFVPYVCCFDLEPLSEDFLDSEPTKPLEAGKQTNLKAAGPFTADKFVNPMNKFSCESNGKKTLSEIMKDYSQSSDPVLRTKMAEVQRNAFHRTEKDEAGSVVQREAEKSRQGVLEVRPSEEAEAPEDEQIVELDETNHDTLKKSIEVDLDAPEAQQKEYSLLTDGIDFSEELSECKNGGAVPIPDFPINLTADQADSPPVDCGLPETNQCEKQEPGKCQETAASNENYCLNLEPAAQASRHPVKAISFPEQFERTKNLAKAHNQVTSVELDILSRTKNEERHHIRPVYPQPTAETPLERWNSTRNLNNHRSSSPLSSASGAVVEQKSAFWNRNDHVTSDVEQCADSRFRNRKGHTEHPKYPEQSVDERKDYVEQVPDTHHRNSDRYRSAGTEFREPYVEHNLGHWNSANSGQLTYKERLNGNNYRHHNGGTAEFLNQNSHNVNSPEEQDIGFPNRSLQRVVPSLQRDSEVWNGNHRATNSKKGAEAFYTPEAYPTEEHESELRYRNSSYTETSVETSNQAKIAHGATYYAEEQDSEFRYRNSSYAESIEQNTEARNVPESSYGEPTTSEEQNFNNRPNHGFYSTVEDQFKPKPKDFLLDMGKSYDLFSSVQSSKTQDFQAKTYQSHDDFFNPVTQRNQEDSQSDYESSLQPKRIKLQDIQEEDSEGLSIEPIQSMTVYETDPKDEKLKDEVLNIVETVLDKSYLDEQSLRTSNAEERLELLEKAVVKSVANPSGIVRRSDLACSKVRSEKPAASNGRKISGDRPLNRRVEFDVTKLGVSNSFAPATPKMSATQPTNSKLNTGLLARNLLGLCPQSPNTFAMSQTGKEKDYSWLKKWSFASQTENVKKLQPSQVRRPEPSRGPKSLKDYLAAVKRSPFLLSQQ